MLLHKGHYSNDPQGVFHWVPGGYLVKFEDNLPYETRVFFHTEKIEAPAKESIAVIKGNDAKYKVNGFTYTA